MYVRILRVFGALAILLLVVTAVADAQIQVNKQFTPNSVPLGGNSVVTITLENSSTLAAANITAFSDDIATMTGHGQISGTPNLTTTCAGGHPSIAGSVVSMNDGVIPIAPSASISGTCTISFNVLGSGVGNGFNTIFAANVVTDLGSPTGDVIQTLNVTTANVGVASASSTIQLLNGTGTVTFTITNPTGVDLTNVAFPITTSAGAAYTINTGTTACAGAVSLPATGTSGTSNVTGLTVPANGSCTITYQLTSPNVTTVNFNLASLAITSDQGITNPSSTSAHAQFISGNPTYTQFSWSASGVSQGGTVQLTTKIVNNISSSSLTNGTYQITLPTGFTLTGAAPTFSGCGSPTDSGAANIVTFAGATIAASGTCIATVTVQVPPAQALGSVSATIASTSWASTEINNTTNSVSASLIITGGGGGVTVAKSFTPTSSGPNVPIKVTIGFTSIASGTFSNGTFTDTIPTALAVLAFVTDVAHTPTFTNCGGTAASTFTSATVFTGSNLSIAPNATCSVAFWVQFTTPVQVNTLDTNTVLAANVSFFDGTSTINAFANASANVTELPVLSVANYIASSSGLVNQTQTMQAQIVDSSGTTDTNIVATFPLTTGKVALAAVPNFTFTGCPAGTSASNITIGPARESFTVSLATISATCAIGYDVIDEAGITGQYSPGNPSYTSTFTGGVGHPLSFGATNTVQFSTTNISIIKVFTPNQIQAGAITTVDVTLGVDQAGTFPTTQANGVTFVDNLPVNVTFAPTPNVTFTAGCQVAGQPAPSFVIAGTTITFSNISLFTTGATPTQCDAKFDVTTLAVLTPTNTIPAHSVGSTSGITNSQTANAALTVNAGIAIQKSFLHPTLQIGGTDYLRFLLINTQTVSTLTAGTLVDHMPASMVLASTTLGPAQGGDPPLCAGSVATAVGTSTFQLTGLTVGGITGPTTPGQCVVYVLVQALATATPGPISNTIGVGDLAFGGLTNLNTATGSTTFVAAAPPTITKSFLPTSIGPDQTSVLTIVLQNPAIGVPLTGVGLTDNLPSGVVLAATPNASTTCGVPVTAVAGATSVAIAGSTLAPGGTCSIAVTVTAHNIAGYLNTIPATALVTTQAVTNALPATATLRVGGALTGATIAKSFSPSTIAAGATSVLSISLTNSSSTVGLTAVSLTDGLPGGVTIAAIPNASTTCNGTISAPAGGGSVSLAGGSIAASTSCSIAVSVTASLAGTYTNVIPAGAIGSAQSASNGSPVQAILIVTPGSNPTISKGFSPTMIPPSGTSTLSISLNNPGTKPLTAVGLTDGLPGGVTIAATPGASTSCGGTVTAAAGGGSVTLAGGTIAASSSCSITVTVTGTTVGSYINTIPAGGISDAQGLSNLQPATATLTIGNVVLTIAKSSDPSNASVSPGQTINYVVSVQNSGTSPETNAKITDTLGNATLVPGSVTVNGVKAADNIVSGGASFGSVAGGTTTTIAYSATVSSTATAGMSITNNVTVGGDQPCVSPVGGPSAKDVRPGVPTCTAASPPNTVALPILGAVKTLNGGNAQVVLPGQTVTYSITVSNSGAGSAQQTVLTDPVPSGVTPIDGTVTVAGVPSTTATVVGQLVTVPLGMLPSSGSTIVTFQAKVNANVSGSQTNIVTVGAAGAQSAITSNEAVATVVSPTIKVSKVASSGVVRVGDRVDYNVTVQTSAGIGFGAATIIDTLPAYQIYAPGTAVVNGKKFEPTLSGRTMTWKLTSLGSSATLSYSTAITVGAPPGQLTNNIDITAVAAGTTTPGLGHGSTSVQVLPSSFGSCYPITGRVYLDVKATGRFEDGDVGIPNVVVFLDDGESVVTDAWGRYNFPCVRPGMHAMRLDQTTLPEGVKPYDDKNYDHEKSTRRLVHKIYDTTIIQDINFAVTGTPKKPIVPPNDSKKISRRVHPSVVATSSLLRPSR